MTTASTTGFPLTPGAAPVLISDGGNVPTGLQLVNRGDNGGTVWIMAGPAGQSAAVPLGPGASLQWTDTAAMPYAYLSTAAVSTETLVVTSQAQGYNNPATVAAALIQQGIPSTFLGATLGAWQLPAGPGVLASASTTPTPIAVGQYSTLIVNVQASGRGLSSVDCRFFDPANPALGYQHYFLTNNNAIEGSKNSWQVPVMGPYVEFMNVLPGDGTSNVASVSAAGTNRPPTGGFRVLGDEIGARLLTYSGTVVANGTYTVVDLNGASPQTRLNGTCKVQYNGPAAQLQFHWVTPNGFDAGIGYNFGAGITWVDFVHPHVPVSYRINALSTTGPQTWFIGVVGQT